MPIQASSICYAFDKKQLYIYIYILQLAKKNCPPFFQEMDRIKQTYSKARERDPEMGRMVLFDGSLSMKHDEQVDFCPENWFKMIQTFFTGFKQPKGDLSNEGQWVMIHYEWCVFVGD